MKSRHIFKKTDVCNDRMAAVENLLDVGSAIARKGWKGGFGGHGWLAVCVFLCFFSSPEYSIFFSTLGLTGSARLQDVLFHIAMERILLHYNAYSEEPPLMNSMASCVNVYGCHGMCTSAMHRAQW